MADQELVAILREGAAHWNRWRRTHAATAGYDLTEASLPRANLAGADLCGADLRRADLFRADLTGADLSQARLSAATLTQAILKGANLREAYLGKPFTAWQPFDHGADLRSADLSEASLVEANLQYAVLSSARLVQADLRKAKLLGADLRRSDLTKANLSEAYVVNASLRYANLTLCDLRKTDLTGADLRDVNLTSADLENAVIAQTRFGGAKIIHARFSPGVDLSNSANRREAASHPIEAKDPILQLAEDLRSQVVPDVKSLGPEGSVFASQDAVLSVDGPLVHKSAGSMVVLLDESLDPRALTECLNALADYFRASGGAGLQIDFTQETLRPVHTYSHVR